ncbi:hypothetical protein O6H91_01G160900 [Diphasiastrum complanatum]|uniref:Uncharacterized protein n=1 Tax=Diphasiastrum complanatum TaxID=34168 RepID=A0ACC2EXV7_DIPCM|nr:hypothetical protein O6H91_01G160900 [Diphasiastrum complanatum]
MDSNKDDAERCVRIARAAMASGNYGRASKFCLKAQRLYPSPEVDALLSELKEGADQEEIQTNSGAGAEESEGFRADSGPVKGDKATRNGFHQNESASTTMEATAEQIHIVRRINKTKDYYEILGLAKGCSEEEVRKAYRKISLKVHPDKNKAAGAEEAFKAVSKAFQCLSEAGMREKYDRYGPEEVQNLFHQQGGMRRQRHNEDFFYDEMFDPNEIFNAFFSGMQNQNGAFRRAHFVYTRGGQGGARAGTDTRSINILGVVQLLSILALFFFSYLPFSQPVYSLQKVSPYQHEKVTKDHGVNYYVKSTSYDRDYPSGSQARWNIEAQIEREYKEILLSNCRIELNMRRWGQITETPNCNKFEQFQRSY